jgi:hypothetical protein
MVPSMVALGHFLVPLAPLVRFSPFRKTHFFERNFGRRLGLKKLHFCTPWKGPKTRFVTKRFVKLQFPLWRLGPKRALCKSTWAAEGPPKEPFLAPWTVPMPIPFCTGFSFAAVILPGPPFSIQAAPREPRFSQMYTIHTIKHNISNGHLDAPEG